VVQASDNITAIFTRYDLHVVSFVSILLFSYFLLLCCTLFLKFLQADEFVPFLPYFVARQ
jgi:hypothetical protein